MFPPLGLIRHAKILISISLSSVLLFFIFLYSAPGTRALPGTLLAAVKTLDLGEFNNYRVHSTNKLNDWWPFLSPNAPDDNNSSSIVDEIEEAAAAAAAVTNAAPALQALCHRTAWQPNLTLYCHSHCGPSQTSICGGLNNARDRLQTCVRLAIDAGATTLLVPTIAARSETALWTIDPAQIPGSGEPVVLCAEAWFSLEKLRRVLGASCPSLNIKDVCDLEINEVAEESRSVVDMPWRLLSDEKWSSQPGRAFREAVDKARAGEQLKEGRGLVLVRFGDPYMAWDYTASGEQENIYKDLFRSLDYNKDLVALGERVVDSPQLRHTPYIGVHLRASNDWPAEWGSPEEQTKTYAAELQRLHELDENLRTVYVSCGNKTAIQFFREAVNPLGFSVLDKWSILESHWPEGLKKVEGLPFDQKAVVEFAPLVHAQYFLGIRVSSMSVIVAQTRTLDEQGDFLQRYVDTKDTEIQNKGRFLEMRGNQHTKLLVIGTDEE